MTLRMDFTLYWFMFPVSIGVATCAMLSGIGGAGLFSDGKLNYIYKLGKTDLSQFMPIPQADESLSSPRAFA